MQCLTSSDKELDSDACGLVRSGRLGDDRASADTMIAVTVTMHAG